MVIDLASQMKSSRIAPIRLLMASMSSFSLAISFFTASSPISYGESERIMATKGVNSKRNKPS